ncbi:MAG: Holo-(acyl-carrier-protein) synthase [Syntrophorhabdus sp. PtaB.Bin047]|jgi:holo-[acyl-carrier protein] synthase|nr:MAG: Holo-(acyl-carrier-protein) synthase [Syntrophorhabdus sp. PtaB.Bin047]
MVGIDIVDIARIGAVLERHGERFLEKVFAPSEIARAREKRQPQEYLAGRFAAKEAFMKARGGRLPWRDIEVMSEKGRPFIVFRGKRYDGVSISHERSYAVSVVICGD